MTKSLVVLLSAALLVAAAAGLGFMGANLLFDEFAAHGLRNIPVGDLTAGGPFIVVAALALIGRYYDSEKNLLR